MISFTARAALLCGTALAFTGSMASAAAAPPPPVSQTPDAAAATLAEVLVTAERREQRLESVPQAITAFDDRRIDVQGIKTLEDVAAFTPGLVYETKTDRVYIRGLGRLPSTFGADGSVALYTDGFYAPSTLFAAGDTLFTQRYEVLRGPQVALYGHNAIGGALNSISNGPTDDWRLEARTSFGSYANENFEAALSGPLAKGLTFRVSASDLQQADGYNKDVVQNRSEGGVRHALYGEVQVKWVPNDQAEFWLKADGHDWRNENGGYTGQFGLATTGAYDTSLTTPSLTLLFNPNYGYNTSATGPIPGSVTGIPAAFPNSNPTDANIRDFARNTPLLLQNKAYQLVGAATLHLSGFDVKYEGGAAGYDLTSIGDADRSSIESYTVPITAGGACATAAIAVPGSCGPLTVYPSELLGLELKEDFSSHEITFLSTGHGPVQWIGGIYYYVDHTRLPLTLSSDAPAGSTEQLRIGNPVNVSGPAVANPHLDIIEQNAIFSSKSLAGYGQVDWTVVPGWTVSGGLRYTSDSKTANEFERLVQFRGAAMNTGTNTTATDVTPLAISMTQQTGVTCLPHELANGEWTRCLGGKSAAFSGTADLKWAPDSSTLAYLRYSHGYKALGLNAGGISPNPLSRPEFLDDFEGGIKKTIAHQLQLDLSVYSYNYHNAQVPIAVATGGLIQTQFTNIPSARDTGVEVSMIWDPTPHLDLYFTYSLNDTRILTDCVLQSGVAVGACYVDPVDPLARQPTAHPVQTIGASAAQSVRGQELPQASKNKVSFNANYTFVFDPGSLTLSGSYKWRDKSFASIFSNPFDEAPAWSQVDVSATWHGPNDRYQVIGSVSNLFDTVGFNSALIGIPLTVGAAHMYGLTPPRLFNVEFRYKFL